MQDGIVYCCSESGSVMGRRVGNVSDVIVKVMMKNSATFCEVGHSLLLSCCC